jgi:tripartite-type tricarboxylate transporter receptor subunit TctC
MAVAHPRRPACRCAFSAGALAAQGYPQKNVQYIIPFVPGGESDVMARWQQTIFRHKSSTS